MLWEKEEEVEMEVDEEGTTEFRHMSHVAIVQVGRRT